MWRMCGLTRDGTAEPVSRDQIIRREREQGNSFFPSSSADREQDWQPYPVDPNSVESAESDDDDDDGDDDDDDDDDDYDDDDDDDDHYL